MGEIPHVKAPAVAAPDKAELQIVDVFKVDDVIQERYKILKKLGEGAYGVVYKVFDTEKNQSAAMKAERDNKEAVLKLEKNVLCMLQGQKHVCRYIDSGRERNINYLIMSLVGKPLNDLRRGTPENKFSVGTMTRLAKQCVQSVDDLHHIGFIHRDLKPGNFAMGRHESHCRTVIMLDFGLCRRYVNEEGIIRSPRSSMGFRGTVRYASLNTHKNKEFARVDDLWCLFYAFVEMCSGSLPWRHLEEEGIADYKKDVQKVKDEILLPDLLKDCPDEFFELHGVLTTYDYTTKPDYGKIQTIFDKIMRRRQIATSDKFDWELTTVNK